MVEAQIDDTTGTGRIVLKPNFSWSWRANLYLLYTLMALSLTIGLGFLLVGAWVILPYSLLEMLVLGLCIVYCVKQCSRLEVITISEHAVLVQRGIKKVEQSWNFHRIWARFLVKPAKHPWDGKTVSIASHGEELELGSFLNARDKRVLVDQLKRVVKRS